MKPLSWSKSNSLAALGMPTSILLNVKTQKTSYWATLMHSTRRAPYASLRLCLRVYLSWLRHQRNPKAIHFWMKKPVITKVSAKLNTLRSPSFVFAIMSLRKVFIEEGMLSRLLKIFCIISSANLMQSWVIFWILPVNEFNIVSSGSSCSLISNIWFSDSNELPGIRVSLPRIPGSLVHCLKMRSKYTSGFRLEFDWVKVIFIPLPSLLLWVGVALAAFVFFASVVWIRPLAFAPYAIAAISKLFYYYSSSLSLVS